MQLRDRRAAKGALACLGGRCSINSFCCRPPSPQISVTLDSLGFVGKSVQISIYVEFFPTGSVETSSSIAVHSFSVKDTYRIGMENYKTTLRNGPFFTPDDSEMPVMTAYWIPFYYNVMGPFLYCFDSVIIRAYERNRLYAAIRKDELALDVTMLVLMILIYYWTIACVLAYPGTNTYFTGFWAKDSNIWYPGVEPEISRLERAYLSAMICMGLVLIIIWFRLFNFLALLPRIGLIPKAMKRMVAGIFNFAVSLGVILVAFAVGLHSIYSGMSPAFMSWLVTFQTMWASLQGNVDFGSFTKDRLGDIGTFIYIAFTFLVLFVLMTFVIAVINEVYEDSTKDESNYELMFRKTEQRRGAPRKGRKAYLFMLWRWMKGHAVFILDLRNVGQEYDGDVDDPLEAEDGGKGVDESIELDDLDSPADIKAAAASAV